MSKAVESKGKLYANCDVCNSVIEVTNAFETQFNCKTCNSVMVVLEDNDGDHHMFELGLIVADTHLPGPKKKYIKHLDGNKSNNKVSNLE